MAAAVESLAAASASATRAASSGTMIMKDSLSHAGLLAHASGVVLRSWNLVRLWSRPTALRSARGLARVPFYPKISSGLPHKWMSSCWARGSKLLDSAAFSALSITTGEGDAREGVALTVSSASLAEVVEFGLGLGGAHIGRVVLTGDRVVSEHKGAQRGVGCGQSPGRSLGRCAFVGAVGVL